VTTLAVYPFDDLVAFFKLTFALGFFFMHFSFLPHFLGISYQLCLPIFSARAPLAHMLVLVVLPILPLFAFRNISGNLLSTY
jgi:hypothetical protein